MPVMDETNLLVGYSFVESMDVLKSKYSSLVLIAIHTSSNEVFPARSPMPLIVHSICLAPDSTAAKLLATERPRSS
jgi:hypothetical protein